jgi:RNA polymerase sigma-70 factor (ECF subfamily)
MTETSPNPDLFLARRASRADREAWEEIIARYGGRIYNLALSFAKNRSEAEDLTQEIFLKLYQNLERYQGNVPLVAWALRLSRNLCIDHYRSLRAQRSAEVVPAAILESLPAAEDSHQEIEAREHRRLVHEVLAELPENLATVLLLRDMQGLAYDEVAAFLELPLGTLKSRLNRARKELVYRMRQRLASPLVEAVEESASC